jgi:CRP-like cAMP-binding protein
VPKEMSDVSLQQAAVGNRLLAALPAEEFRQLAPRLARVELQTGQVLHGAEEAVGHVFFVERALLSLLSPLEDGTAIEVGAVGREGVGGLPAILGGGASPHRVVAQVGGPALRMRAAEARAAFAGLPHFRAGVLRYARLLLMIISQTAACNALHTVEHRLARWLLLSARRLETDRLPLTHEYLAHMLGVRRSGVTVASGVLERAGLIRHSRGRITVLDAAGLRGAACECVRTLSAEFDQFLGE